MPRRKPNLNIFRNTPMYKETKGMCAMTINNKDANDNWSLQQGLMRRECGLIRPRCGSFTMNQHRRIANQFVPNKKVDRLMALDTKMFICCYNKDGSCLLTASQDSIIRIFDATNDIYHRVRRLRLRDMNWSILDLDFSPCGKYFAYSTWSNFFYVANLYSETDPPACYRLINGNEYENGMFSVRFSPVDGGRILVGGCDNSNIFICDRTRSVTRLLISNTAIPVDVNAVSFTSELDGNTLVSGCNNGLLQMWDLRCYMNSNSPNRRYPSAPVGIFLGHLDGITYVNPRNDGRYFLSNSRDQTIKIWDLRKPSPSCDSTPPLPPVEYSVNMPGEYTSADASVMTYRGHRVSKTLLRAKFSPRIQTGQRYIYTGCSTGRIIIYDVLTGQIKEAIESHRNIIRDLDWHPHRSEIASASWDCQVNLNGYRWNASRKRGDEYRSRGLLRRSSRIARREKKHDVETTAEESDVNEW